MTQMILDFGEDIPVIILTGHNALIDYDKAAALGADAFVINPIWINDIAMTIQNILQKKKNEDGHYGR